MKTYYIIFLFLLSSIAQAQIVNIPDPNFLNVLVNTNCVDTTGDGRGDSKVDTNNDGLIQLSEAEAVLRLVLTGPSITSLEGIQSFVNLDYLRCYIIGITSLDVVTQNLNLKTLIIEDLGIPSLDVTQMTDLTYLNFHANALSSLDLSQNPNLRTLIGSWNQLTALDVSQNPELKELTVYHNSVTNIDVTANQNLETLSISNNPINILDVNQNQNLKILRVESTELTSLDVRLNTNLKRLSVGRNELTSLDISQNHTLETLSCDENKLTNLDISNNTNLFSLSCENNQLISLNIKNGANTTLVDMKARNNPNLECIQVDNAAMANSKYCIIDDPLPSWCKDGTAIFSEDCSLGVEDNYADSFNLYPNPVRDILYIEAIEVPMIVEIYSTAGILIETTSNLYIDVSDLASGLYFIKVSMQGRNSTKKFIKI